MFVPFVMRVGVAIMFALLAHHFYRMRAQFAVETFPIIGKPGMPLTYAKVTGTAALAALFTVGLFTQAVAILGFLGALKCAYFAKRYPQYFPHGRAAYLLLALISFTLLFLHAGAFAIDKPF